MLFYPTKVDPSCFGGTIFGEETMVKIIDRDHNNNLFLIQSGSAMDLKAFYKGRSLYLSNTLGNCDCVIYDIDTYLLVIGLRLKPTLYRYRIVIPFSPYSPGLGFELATYRGKSL